MKCPKCGFDQADGTAECIRCGIVIARFISKPKMLFSTRIVSLKPGLLQHLFYPAAIVKHYFEIIYTTFFNMAHHEFMQEGGYKNLPIQVLLRVVFCLLSLCAYYLRDYDDLILYTILSAWGVDYLLTVHRYRSRKPYDQISLRRGADGRFTYALTGSAGGNRRMAFTKSEVVHVFIARYSRRGGAFRSRIQRVWRITIALESGDALLMHEDADLAAAVRRARKFSRFFQVPLSFENSEDESFLNSEHYGDLRRRLLQNRSVSILSGRLALREEPESLRISSEWTPRARGYFLHNLFQRSGFFLFVLIAGAVMVPFGNLLDLLLGLNIGREGRFMIDLSLSGVMGVITPELGWNDLLEWAVAIALMVASARKICHSKHLCMDADEIALYVDETKTATLPMQGIDFPVFLAAPERMLVIANHLEAMAVTNLQSDDEYRAFMIAVHRGINRFGNGKEAS